MQKCFHEAFRILKAGRWMTVVFSNIQNLKTNIEQAGFIIANIATLNKYLIISAYKPNKQSSQQVELNISDEASAIKQEKRHEKQFLREFRQYKQHKRLKKITIEALRTGFKQAWKQQDYHTIITIAEKIPKMVLYEDEQLLQFYEFAKVKF
jgi:hypothetical protein